MNEDVNYIGNNNQVLITVIAPKHQRLFVVTVHLICFQFHTGNSTFSFLCNIECDAVIVVLHTLLTARIVHQMIEKSELHIVVFGIADFLFLQGFLLVCQSQVLSSLYGGFRFS